MRRSACRSRATKAAHQPRASQGTCTRKARRSSAVAGTPSGLSPATIWPSDPMVEHGREERRESRDGGEGDAPHPPCGNGVGCGVPGQILGHAGSLRRPTSAEEGIVVPVIPGPSRTRPACRLLPAESSLARPEHHLHPVRGPQLPEDRRDHVAHRLGAQEQPVAPRVATAADGTHSQRLSHSVSVAPVSGSGPNRAALACPPASTTTAPSRPASCSTRATG